MNGTPSERRTLRLAAGLVAFVAASAFAAAALAASGSISDPANDNTGAVDISSVTISEPAAGRLLVAVTIGNAERLPADSRIDLWFDLDNDLKTGDDGDEALVRYQANGRLSFSRWDSEEDELVTRPTTGMTATYQSGTLTYEAPRAAFDEVPTFGLLVVTRGIQAVDDEEAAAYDALPEIGRVPYASPGPHTFQDRKDDVPRAPDLRSVTVSDAKNGMIRLKVATSDPALLNDGVVRVAIDRDLLGGEGPAGRAEVLLDYTDGRFRFRRWDPKEEEWMDDEAPTRAHAGVVGNSVVFEVHRSELDDVARFGFTVESWIEDDDDVVAFDLAPSNGGSTYRLVHRPPLRLIAGELFGVPSRPVAGRPFSINLPLTRSDTARKLAKAKITCDVRAEGRQVRATASIAGGIARCAVVVPRNALAVRGSMKVRSAGESVTAWFAGAIDFGGQVEEGASSR
jgi:hypothetical protein